MQGLGIGTRVANAVASAILREGKRYFSRTAHPRFGQHRHGAHPRPQGAMQHGTGCAARYPWRACVRIESADRLRTARLEHRRMWQTVALSRAALVRKGHGFQSKGPHLVMVLSLDGGRREQSSCWIGTSNNLTFISLKGVYGAESRISGEFKDSREKQKLRYESPEVALPARSLPLRPRFARLLCPSAGGQWLGVVAVSHARDACAGRLEHDPRRGQSAMRHWRAIHGTSPSTHPSCRTRRLSRGPLAPARPP